MTPTWNDLANSARWRGVVSFVRHWVGAFDPVQGMAAEELDSILRAKLLIVPAAVREWYMLAANWSQGGLNVWKRPQGIAICDGIIWVLTDTEGINQWGVRVADFDMEDPPVVSDVTNNEIVARSFSEFVAAMIVNDVLFDHSTEEPIELNPESACAEPMRLFSSCCGDFFADGVLESATVVMFAYKGNGPVFGKSRTTAGSALLQRLRRRQRESLS